MATTIYVVCPSCKKAINAPDSVEGKKIKCKSCAQVFVAKASTEPPSAAKADAKKKDDEEWGVIKAYGVTVEKLKPRCPFCAWELEFEDDVICLHCGYNLQTRERLHQRIVEPHTGADYFAWWLPPCLCILLSLALAGAIVWIWWAWRLDWGMPWSEATKVYCTVMCLGAIYFSSKFALRRMIFHPHPPEKALITEIGTQEEEEGKKKPIRRRSPDDDDDDDDDDEDDDDEDEDD